MARVELWRRFACADAKLLAILHDEFRLAAMFRYLAQEHDKPALEVKQVAYFVAILGKNDNSESFAIPRVIEADMDVAVFL